jgi:hypothetical protein
MTDPTEALWNSILSRKPERIKDAFLSLTSQEKIAVRAHLIKMTTEDGWLPVQIESAWAALKAIKNIPDV